ncbi:NB-ARC domain-containing protein [Streptomyces sp. ND04-05B]|uniref:NB-ARC domain-containing protein n=1 Tax=Streptomyces sp. ND04-05B TaxID=3028693 RepID=UPI0029B06E00|nr:NB-ARC domain-containing protein [Streptomyces sp. ND04-05B]MDX3065773.1 NB-ARC domain-containing protein [Streptomyces sp. ND04-05B]
MPEERPEPTDEPQEESEGEATAQAGSAADRSEDVAPAISAKGENTEQGELLPADTGQDANMPANVHPMAWKLARVLRPLFDALGTTMTAYGVKRHLHKSTVSRYLNGVQVPPVDFVENLFVDYVGVTKASPARQLRGHVMRLQSEAMRATNPQGWQIQDLRAKWSAAEGRRERAEQEAQRIQQDLDEACERLARSQLDQDTLREEATRLALAQDQLLRKVDALESERRAVEQRAADYETQCRTLAQRLEAAERAEECAIADREAAVEDSRQRAERQARREIAGTARPGSGAPGEDRRRHVLFAGPDAPWAAWLCGRLAEPTTAVSAETLSPLPGESAAELLQALLHTADLLLVLSSRLHELARYTPAEWSAAFRLIGERHPGRLTVVVPDHTICEAHDGVSIAELGGANASEADRILRRALGWPESPMPPAPAQALPISHPGVWGQVPRRDERFTGRDALLWTIHQQLTADALPPATPPPAAHPIHSPAPLGEAVLSYGPTDPAGDDVDGADHPPASTVRTLVGMPGVGKTAVAAEYAHRFSGLYDVVWWVDASSQDTVRSALAQLAEELAAPRGEPGAELDALYTALSSPSRHDGGRRILLVFDGAEDPSALAPMLPGHAVRILITTQNRAWERYAADLIGVPCFTWSESLACVTRFDPKRGLHGDRALALAVGDHPGALVRAMTEHCPGDEVRLPTLAEAMGRLHTQAPQARLLLRMSDCFAQGAVPLRWLQPLPTPDGTPWEATAHALAEASLAYIDETATVHVHPLVRRTAVRGAYDDHLHQASVLAVDALTRADPQLPENPAQWPRYAALLPHLETSGALDSNAPAARRLVSNCLAYCRWSGDRQGIHLATRAAAGRAAIDGPKEPDHELLAMRVRLLHEAGRIRQAGELLAQTEVRKEDPHASRHLVAAKTAALLSAGRYEEADRHARAAYEHQLTASGTDAPGTIQVRALLTECARALGHWERSLELGTEVLTQYRKVMPWALQALYARSRHALDLRLLGRYTEAEDEQTAALRGLIPLLGPLHPQTIAAKYELAMCRWHAGHPNDAAFQLDRLRRIVLRLPDASPLTLQVLAAYSWVARHTTQGDPADISGRQALDGYRAILPDGHPHLLGLAANAALTAAGCHLGQARSALEHNWQELRTKLGPAHPWVLGLALTLSGSRCADGDGDGAAELSGTAQEKAATALGARHPVTLLLTIAHAADLRALGRIERADKLDSLARRELGQHHAGHPQTQAVTEGKRPVWEFEPLPLHGLP